MNDSRHRNLKSIMRMPILLPQRPNHPPIQHLRIEVVFLCHLDDDAVDGFGFLVLFFAFDDFFGGDAAFGEVDVACGGSAASAASEGWE